MMNKKTLWITQTAVFTALLITAQFGSSFLGLTLITGMLVNLLLIIPTVTVGFSSGLIIAVISPVLAKLLGIGPLWELIPFIMLGNISLLTIWHLIVRHLNFHSLTFRQLNTRLENSRLPYRYGIAAFLAALVKFLVLYIGVVMIAIPFLLNLAPEQAAVIGAMFSVSQFATALTGGCLATVILPVLQKAGHETRRR